MFPLEPILSTFGGRELLRPHRVAHLQLPSS